MDYDLPGQNGAAVVRVRTKVVVRNKTEANFLAAKKQAELLRGEFDDFDLGKMGTSREALSGDMTLGGFLPRFRELRDQNRGRKKPLSPRYVHDQDRQIELFIEPRFGEMALKDIDIDAIDNFVTDLLREEHPAARPKKDEDGVVGHRLASATVNNIIGHLSRILTVAFSRKLIPARPIIEKMPEEHDDEFDFLEKDEVHRLFAACKGQYGNMIKLIVLTGARAMEASGLRWQDYDPVRKRIRIEQQLDHRSGKKNRRGKREPRFRPPKWNSKRWVDVPPTLVAILNEQAAFTRLKDGLIFQTEEGNPVVHDLLSRRLKQACRRANLRAIAPHVLRKTFISHRIMAGDNPVLVQRLAGHRSIQTTIKYYTRLGVAYTQEAASKFEDYLFGTEDSAVDSAAKSG
jgi:integrase